MCVGSSRFQASASLGCTYGLQRLAQGGQHPLFAAQQPHSSQVTGRSSALAVATHSEHHPPRRRLSVSSCPSPSPARKRPSHHARTSIHGLAVPLLRCQGSFIHYSPPAGSRRRRWSEGARPVGGCMHLQVVVVVAPSGGALMRARTAASPSSRPAGRSPSNERARAR